MKTSRMEKQKCPTCGRENDAATCLDFDVAPRPGDTSICIGCQNVHIFTDDLSLRPATEKDIDGMPLDAVSRTQRLLTEAKAKT